MTRAELRAEVFRRLEESSSSPVFWTVADVDLALNEGYAEISDAAEWREVTLTVDLLASRPAYDLRTLLADPVLSVRGAYCPATNRWLTPSTVKDLDALTRRWEARTGQPERFFLRSLWWLTFWPFAAADSGTVDLKVTTLPWPLSEDGDVPGFEQTLHYALVEYALADLWAQDSELTKAFEAWQRYLAYETTLAQYLDGRLAVPMVAGLAPGGTA